MASECVLGLTTMSLPFRCRVSARLTAVARIRTRHSLSAAMGRATVFMTHFPASANTARMVQWSKSKGVRIEHSTANDGEACAHRKQDPGCVHADGRVFCPRPTADRCRWVSEILVCFPGAFFHFLFPHYPVVKISIFWKIERS